MKKDGLTKRGEAAEIGFAHEEELAFQAIVLRNKKLGAWAAELMGLSSADSERYLEQLVLESINQPKKDAVFKKMLDDFDIYKIDCTERTLRRTMEQFLQEAKQEIHKGK